ncbi:MULTISPECIES: protein kinase domain-containing protein [unclassified Coleofasciculus]|uniref:protein kinase domain-containing protein n=1 Tax=unclassified Coleofasciculus TaxID=2692782 RepID=UPI00188090D5|nr:MULTISPECIES: protein kinase [unclassified Coleofasciculus]MBE9127107.1 protein kinase [Coleofasciculus sp. LEGE 07081]MBE9150430.1 protein kinase [Coleofasciculus sp. LEGE 07092]
MTPTLLNNRYRVLRTLGTGGFGNTFLAEDTHMPSGRNCVIKQLKSMTHNPQTYKLMQERFQREAAVLEELGESHNQIPCLYAYFWEAGRFYLIQEWIEGDTLTQKVEREGRLSESEVKAILLSLLPILDYVHSRRMIHRDIKPDNIILRQRDGLPVLIDFGAVKEAIQTVVNSQTSAAQSMVIGTPGFMAAEQAAGRSIYASDLYSLGLVAVFLLTGRLPQGLETDSRTGEILWRRDASQCHSHLAAVLDRAIRFHPRDRFTSAREMLEVLRSNTSTSTLTTVPISSERLPPVNNPVVPPTVPMGWRYGREENRHQSVIVGGLMAGGLLIAGVAVGLGINRSLDSSNPAPSLTEPISERPLLERLPPDSTSVPSPLSTPIPKPVFPESPAPPLNLTPEPLFPKSPELPSTPPPELTLPKSPAPLPTLTPSPSPSLSPSPLPKPSPSPENPKSNALLANNIPGFAPGTPQKAVELALGKPTQQSKGLWPNTRALVYEDYIPNRVSLGYLFDRNSGRLRQTEAAFNQSVELETLLEMLDRMLNGNVSGDIQQGLTRVYQRQSNRYRFSSSGLKGVIERNQSDRIYMGVWEADLH